MSSTPTTDDAAAIVQQVLRQPVQSVVRFSTGLAHYVYEVVTASGTTVVAAMARAGETTSLAGAVYWSQRLRPLNVPLPRILHADIQAQSAPFPYVVLERLPGTDLGHVYGQLTTDEKRAIAAAVVQAQAQTSSLPRGNGFGYATSYESPFPHQTWRGVIEASLSRSRSRIAMAQVFDTVYVDRLLAQLPRFDHYLAHVQPVAFLDDTTTKNVLVHEGRLSGIVDVDVVCFGDPIWTIGLTQMALLSGGHDLEYIRAWSELAKLTDEQEHVLQFYTAVFCVDFMSEIGQTFNRDEPIAADHKRVQHLKRIFEVMVPR